MDSAHVLCTARLPAGSCESHVLCHNDPVRATGTKTLLQREIEASPLQFSITDLQPSDRAQRCHDEMQLSKACIKHLAMGNILLPAATYLELDAACHSKRQVSVYHVC